MIYIKDYISLPDRALLSKDAKKFLEAMEIEFRKNNKVDISFKDVKYAASIFLSESIGSFLYNLGESFTERAIYSCALNFYDYQSNVQELALKELIRLSTDKEYHDIYVWALENNELIYE